MRRQAHHDEMKRIEIAKLLALAITLTFAVTACHKRPGIITPLPNRPPGLVGGERAGDLAGKVPSPDEVKTGGGETAEFNVDDMIQDRAALAAQTVHFDFDSSVVKTAEKPRVQAVASALKSDSAAKLLIEGHCDERGTEEYNRSLGERR